MSGRKKFFIYKKVKANTFGVPILDDTPKKKINKTRKRRKPYYKTFDPMFSESAPKNLIVMYDIPDDKKKERDWFRRHLIRFGYVMIQKSVWVGPSPLPKEFLAYLKEIKIGDKLKTLKLAKPYNSSISAIA